MGTVKAGGNREKIKLGPNHWGKRGDNKTSRVEAIPYYKSWVKRGNREKEEKKGKLTVGIRRPPILSSKRIVSA